MPSNWKTFKRKKSLKKIFFDKIIQEGKPTGFVDSDYDINDLSDSKEKTEISEEEEDSEEYQHEQGTSEEKQQPRMVESKTSIMNRRREKKKEFQTNGDKAAMLYSGITQSDQGHEYPNNQEGRWNSPRFEENFLSEENDEFDDSEDSFRDEKKLNNNLAKNIQKNNRLKSGLSSFRGKRKRK